VGRRLAKDAVFPRTGRVKPAVNTHRKVNHVRRRRRELVRHDGRRLRVAGRLLRLRRVGRRGGCRRRRSVLGVGVVLVRLAELLEVEKVLDREPVPLNQRYVGGGLLRRLFRREGAALHGVHVHPPVLVTPKNKNQNLPDSQKKNHEFPIQGTEEHGAGKRPSFPTFPFIYLKGEIYNHPRNLFPPPNHQSGRLSERNPAAPLLTMGL
jgi:hypothetical protein